MKPFNWTTVEERTRIQRNRLPANSGLETSVVQRLLIERDAYYGAMTVLRELLGIANTRLVGLESHIDTNDLETYITEKRIIAVVLKQEKPPIKEEYVQ